MKFGLEISDCSKGQPVSSELDDILRIVETGQRHGFSSFFMGQNFLYRDSRWLAPIPVFARLAAELDGDTRLSLNVLPLPLYEPVALAEDLATLDNITKGRLDVGVGSGYRTNVFEALRIPFAERYARLEEGIALLKLLWTEQTVNFEGRFWTMRGATPDIKPLQKPHPPLWLGTWGERGTLRAARLTNALAIPPKIVPADVHEMCVTFARERGRLGLPQAVHPIRRDIYIGRTRDEALARLVSITAKRYADERASTTLAADIPEQDDVTAKKAFMSHYAIVGTADDCITQLRALCNTCPLGPIVVQPQWQGMPIGDALRYIEEIGRVIIPALRDMVSQPVRF